MNQVAYLLDEHIDPAVLETVSRIEPAIRIRLVGWDADAPPKRTSDPDLLAFAEKEQMAIVTFDKTTMPGHTANHLAAGHHTWGVFIFANGNNLGPGRIAEELVLVWATSQQDEWVDRIEFLPY